MDTWLAIASRREVRDYAPTPIPDEVVHRILDAGRLTGSSSNSQQWEFVVVSDKVALAEAVYAPGNVLRATLVVAIAGAARPFDVGRASQNMMLAAWNDGVTSCPNGMPDAAATGEILGLGEDEHVINVISFGYPAGPRSPQDRPAEEWLASAKRKSFDEVVERR